jgi:predicted nucleic acid-binding protein
MRGKRFYDTCILVYALAQRDHREEVAHKLLAEGGAISVQVLNEFAAVAKRKYRLSFDEIAALSSASIDLCGVPLPLTVQTHEAAMKIARRYYFNFYDCLIIASALESGCRTLYTEDLQHNQQIEGLQVINPFFDGSGELESEEP